jgi:cobalt-zinc-cadmium efflux system outer membrane protein
MAAHSQMIQASQDMLRRAYTRYLSAVERYQLSSNAWKNWQKIGLVSLQRQGELLKRMWEAGELSTTDYLVQLQQTLDTRDNILDLNLRMWRAWFEWLSASGQVSGWLGAGETS